ncbi:MAG: DUF58 domain-containing protein [Candidatus Hydrogenedentes bacterium]|nr:DUF58 domain-containing protein [Candidatus Hydrogenedentota bacterium]
MKRRTRKARGYTRITKVGWGHLVILTLGLMAAWNTGTNLLYIIVGGMASFVLLSYGLSFFLLRHLTLHRSAPKAAYRGCPFQVHVRVENHRRWFSAASLRLQRGNGTQGGGYVGHLPAGQAARLSLEECFEKRGEHSLDGYRVVCGFPFGLIERHRDFHDEIEVLVYPRVHIVRASALQRVPSASQMSSQSSDDGDEYFGLREYVPGDDIRRIAWRISARLGKWIVRELAQYQSRLVVLALDTTYNSTIDDFNERFEEAVELVASIAIMLLRRRNEVSIITPDGLLEGGDGKGHERRVLELLACVTVSEEKSTFSQRVSSMDSLNAVVFLISPDPEAWGTTTENGCVLDPRELVHG